MPSSYSTILRLELPADGEQEGTWGDTTNRNIGTLLEQAIAGTATVTLIDADVTLTTVSGGSDEARAAILSIVGAATVTRNVTIPSLSKTYVVSNFTSGSQSIIVKTSAGTGVTINNGVTAHVYCNGAEVYLVSNNEAAALGTVTSITVSSPLTGGTITSTGTIGMGTVPGLVAGTYGAATAVPVFTVDVYGRITYASQISIGGGVGSGTVTQVNAGSGLTGGPITSSGTLSLSTSGVTASTYGGSSNVPVITVDIYGRVTSISTTSVSAGTSITNTGGTVEATTAGVSITGPLTLSSGIIGTPPGTVNIGSATTELHVGGDTTSNRVIIAASGSVVGGILYDGTSIFVGRGTPGVSVNALKFDGNTTAGTATFTVTTVYKTGGGSFAATSDERLKDIQGSYEKGLEAVLALEPIRFTYKSGAKDEFVGVSAQKVRETQLASMVRAQEDGYLAVDNSELVYTLVNAVKELNQKIEDLADGY